MTESFRCWSQVTLNPYSWFTERCVREGELCQDMFISPESDVCATCAPWCATYLSILCNQEALVNGRTLFTADHALFTMRWHMDPWVLFQLSEQQRERWCSNVGGSLSDLQASMWEAEREGETEGDSASTVRQADVEIDICVFWIETLKLQEKKNRKSFLCHIQQRIRHILSVSWLNSV